MGAVGTSASGGVSALPKATVIDSQDKIKQLQKDMGQTGYEAGDPNESPNQKLYAKTGKAFNINSFLNHDEKTFFSSHSNWNDLIDKPWVQNAIKQLDKGMKPMSENIQVTRFLDGDSLGYMMPGIGVTNANFSQFVDKLENNKTFGDSFKTVLKDVDYTHKGYTSTTYTQSHPAFDTRDIKLNMVIRQGTPAIVTNNHAEREILAGRNLKYNFTGGYKVVTTPSGKKQLVLDVYI